MSNTEINKRDKTINDTIHYGIAFLANNGYKIIDPNGNHIVTEQELGDLIERIEDTQTVQYNTLVKEECISGDAVQTKIKDALAMLK